ncbi:hypothetical protein AH04_240 [Erwinia phage AH04]|uniref:Uncharacterized protein n=1 Tax=Erwinia phage AH04 TaxID=2869569 RepID=A0AAE7X134_9CAUD|nr:hypothetical protein PQC02_gp074 [Erwinia phage AH04]QZA70713.1 hypothetical protein AH04_240 [Erwinia phage AH04]
MIDTLIGALKISLNQCNTIEHPVEYVYEINQVLNRFKSNLFKLIPDKAKHLYDPKEFIQLRLCLGWKINPTYTGFLSIKEQSPVLLHVNGFIPELGLRKNKETTFIKAVDVSDIINLEKIATIRTDYNLLKTETISEIKTIEEHLGHTHGLCVYYDREARNDGVQDFTMQIAAVVYSQVDSLRYQLVPVVVQPKYAHCKVAGAIAGRKSAISRGWVDHSQVQAV